MKRFFLIGLCAIASCNNSGMDRDFERMVNQPRYEVYEESEFFPDRRAMRTPPEGTIPVDGALDEAMPERLTRAELLEGQRHFRTFCAPCHGELGDGVSIVGKKMELRPPPSLISKPVSDYPPERIYQAITNGYGVMPTYRSELSARERWGVVGYVRALQIRAGVPLDVLPEPIRERAKRELP